MLEDLWKPTGSPEHATQDAAEMNRLLHSLVFEVKRLRTDVIDRFGLERARRVPRCLLERQATQSIAAPSANISWDTEIEDFFGLHSASSNPDRITLQEPGLYLFQTSVRWDDANTAGEYLLDLQVFDSAGAPVGIFNTTTLPVTTGGVVDTWQLAAGVSVAQSGHYGRVQVAHDDSLNNDITFAAFAAFKIGGLVRED